MPYKNYMEEAVFHELRDLLEGLDVCKCERCQEDMVAWSLNRLPSKYVVTNLGRAYTKLNQIRAQAKTDIVVALMKAVEIVKENPRH